MLVLYSGTSEERTSGTWMFALSREVVLFKRCPYNAPYSTIVITGVNWLWQKGMSTSVSVMHYSLSQKYASSSLKEAKVASCFQHD